MPGRFLFRPLVLTVAALALSACASALATGPALWTDYSDRPTGYLVKGQGPDTALWLTPPPIAGSPAALADLDAYRATRALRGSPRWAQATRDAELFTPTSALGAFACALGADIAPERAPHLARLLVRIPSDVDIVVNGAKDKYRRKRPFVTTPGPICVAMEPWLPGSGSYPSGHAASGWAWALILSQLAPDAAAPILARGAAIGDSRVICGVHYPSDVEAGRKAGAAVVATLQSRADFRADLEVARRELAAARRDAPAPDCAAERAALGAS